MGCASSQQYDQIHANRKGQSQNGAFDIDDKRNMDDLHNSLARLNTKDTSAPDWQSLDVQKLLQQDGQTEDCGNSIDWWDVVDKLNSKTASTIQAETKRVVWKTIRLFVSSTFKDMNCEREHLVEKVFPQLRQWCEERKLRLIECDLRWGIPKDADTSETLIGCLSQIDRCREENECPYFLCMLSERYGWCPSGSDVPDHIKTRYKWIPGLSVTSMEIFTGAYWDHNPNALFMLRDANFVKDIANSVCKAACTESNEKAIKSLKILKEKLRERFAGQVSDYKPSVANKTAVDLQLSGLEQFGQTVLERLKSMIDRQYPADGLGETLSLSEMQRTEHENFMIQRSQVLLGRNDILEQIRAYIKGDNSKPSSLVLVGSPGAGKSAIIAYCSKEFSAQANCKTFYHFVGATPGSTDLYQLLTRLWTDLAPPGEQIPSDLDEMVRSMDAMFVRAAAATKKDGCDRLVVFIDALNQMDDEGGAHKLNWLPDTFPRNMRVVVSTLDGRCREALKAKKSSPREIIVEPLNTETRKQIANQILSEFSKKLDTEQLNALVSKGDAGRPLWLSVACEELRIFGSFSKLLDKIRDLPGQLTDLLQAVLTRIIGTFGGDLVVATLCLIETSRFGLLETELVELLAGSPVLPASGAPNMWAAGDKIPMATWAMIFVGLKQYLRPSGNSGEGRLDFYHRTISKVVRNEYLDDTQKIQAWHTRLADYFEKCSDVQRKAEELPYHLEAIVDLERLKACLSDLQIFTVLYTESTKPQLMKYWQLIGGYEVAAHEYIESLKQYIQENSLTDIDDIEPIQIRVAMFILDIGEYEAAEELLQEVKDKISEKYGSDSKRLSGPLTALVALKTQQANKFVYGRHQGYRDAMVKGRQLGEQCVKIYKKYWAADDIELGRTLGFCGYFCRDGLPEARRILEAAGDLQNLASVIYMMGKDNEHHKDMNVPVQLYEQSLKLCKSQFGKFHLKTARCFQLYGQMFWNRYVRVGLTAETTDWLNKCLVLYQEELEILEELLGATHPTTVRSRADVVIILERLGRKQESQQLATKQPAQHDAL